jgi:hypothetical protein
MPAPILQEWRRQIEAILETPSPPTAPPPEYELRGYDSPSAFNQLWGRMTTRRNPQDLWELDWLLEYQEVLLQNWTVSLRD